MGFTSVGPEQASLAPALSIAKNSGVARDRRRDIIVMERTMLRTDCDTYALAALRTRAFATAVHPRP